MKKVITFISLFFCVSLLSQSKPENKRKTSLVFFEKLSENKLQFLESSRKMKIELDSISLNAKDDFEVVKEYSPRQLFKLTYLITYVKNPNRIDSSRLGKGQPKFIRKYIGLEIKPLTN